LSQPELNYIAHENQFLIDTNCLIYRVSTEDYGTEL